MLGIFYRSTQKSRTMRLASALVCLTLLTSACSVLQETPAPPVPVEPVATPVPTVAPTLTQAPTLTAVPPTATAEPELVEPTAPPTELPVPTDPPSTTEPVQDGLFIEDGQLNIYPPGKIYAGDQVTFHLAVSIPDTVSFSNVAVRVDVNGERLTQQSINGRNLGREYTLILPLIWDTTGLEGTHTITFTADPDDVIQEGDENLANNQMNYELVVHSATENLGRADQTWIVKEIPYARIHVVSGTAAERDLEKLAITTEASIKKAIDMLGEEPRRIYDVYFIERVVGQGGYAGGSMVITYNDRNYTGGRIDEVIVHETVHLLDQQISRYSRITFLAEGLAVYTSGGHYKPEDLNARAAALVATGNYIPLSQIVDNFYPVQHEIGYLEAGAFVQYLVDTYGWDQFKEFYADFQPAPNGINAPVLNEALLADYGKTLEQIEQDWLTKLGEISLDREVVADLNGTIRFYNIMRRYQSIHDPTAYFLEAWLPRPNLLRDRGATAELTRHPEETINLVLEVMLTEAEILLRSGNFRQAEVLMGSIERALDNQNNFIDPLGATYNEIVLEAHGRGYEIQRILLDGQSAIAVYTINNQPTLYTLEYSRQGAAWAVVQ